MVWSKIEGYPYFRQVLGSISVISRKKKSLGSPGSFWSIKAPKIVIYK